MSAGERFTKLIRYGLIGLGALFIISALVNIASAWFLIEPSDEQSLGISRTEIVGWYGAFFVAGAVLVFAGLRRK